MNRSAICLLTASLTLFLPSASTADIPVQKLWDDFTLPPDEARTKVWWFHGETPDTEEGIDADLRAFKEKGVGGVVFYDQVHGKGEGAAPSMSDEWWHYLKYSARRARELGLSFEVAVGNGYVTGGPWITPELAMKRTEYAEMTIYVPEGNSGTVKIPLPKVSDNFRDIATFLFPVNECMESIPFHGLELKATTDSTLFDLPVDSGEAMTLRGITYSLTPRGKGSTGSMNIPGKPSLRYFGAGYTDNPPAGRLEYSDDGVNWSTACELPPLENNIGHKSRRRTVSFPAVTAHRFRINAKGWRADGETRDNIVFSDIVLHRRDVVDNVEVKTGLRTEVTYPHPVGAGQGALRLDEVSDVTDMINPDGCVSLDLPAGTWKLLRIGYVPTGARTKHGRKNLLGLEADVMSAEAANVQYDNYFRVILDTLSSIGCRPQGMCQDSHEAGTQNWTRGLDSIFARDHGYDIKPWLPAFAGYIVESRESTDKALRDFRLTVAGAISDNYYGTFASRCKADGVTYTSQAMLNIDNDNIMSRGRADKPQGEFWAYQTDGNYDCLDAASSAHLYGHPVASAEAFTDTPYGETWEELLRIAGIAWCRGINEFVVCASSAQPWLDRKYDDSASAHPYVFHRFHPDWENTGGFWDTQARCAHMLRQGEPVVDLCVYVGEEHPVKTMSFRLPDVPEGYKFDVCNKESLLDRMSVSDGVITVKGGMKYRALLIEDRTYISPEVNVRLDSLERAGAVIVRCGLGDTLTAPLAQAGITPDLSFRSAGKPDDCLMFYHRHDGRRDIYYIYNHSDKAFHDSVRLRSHGVSAERWDPVAVSRQSIPMSAEGEVDLHVDPHGHLFIVTE